LGKGIPDHMGHASISIGAMDARWQWSKACDTRVTPSGLWTLAGSGETPEKCTITCIFNIPDVLFPHNTPYASP
jgi:hypothetical protein